MALGIVGLVCCGICGIIAWVMGNSDLAQMDAGVMDPAGRGLTKAGRIMGIISVVLMVLGVIASIFINLLAPKPNRYGSRNRRYDVLGQASPAVRQPVRAQTRPQVLANARRPLLRRALPLAQ